MRGKIRSTKFEIEAKKFPAMPTIVKPKTLIDLVKLFHTLWVFSIKYLHLLIESLLVYWPFYVF